MAVELTSTEASFTGTGALATFAAPIYANDDDQIKVYVDGSMRTLGDDYVLNGLGSSAGISIVANFPAGAAVYVERVTPIKQEVDTQNNETILEDVLDGALDKLTMMMQERSGETSRAILVPKGETGLQLPSRPQRPGRFLGFGADPDLLLALLGGGGDALLRGDLAASTAGAKLVNYLLSNLSSQPQAVADKLALRIDVWDFLTPAMRASVKNGDMTVSTSPAFNAAINYANGGESTGIACGGFELDVRPGRWLLDEPIKNTFRYDQDIADDGDLRRMNIRGGGTANTSLFYSGDPSKPFYQVRGNRRADGLDLYHHISGLRFRRVFGARGQGTGVSLLDVADVHWFDVHVDGFNVGIDAQGVLGWTAFLLQILGNNGGLSASLGAGFTRPNAWQFVGGKISGNSVYGAQFTNAANVGMLGVRLEANGAGEYENEPNKANQFVLLMAGAPAEGGHWLDMQNCYLENNNVETEIAFSTAGADSATARIVGTSFQRISNTRNPNRHIDFFNGGPSRLYVHLDSVAFRAIGGYNPALPQNANHHPWRNQTGLTYVTTTNVLYELPAQQPEHNNFPAIGYGYENTLMTARVAADGTFLGGWNVASVAKQGTGVYRLNYARKPASALTIPNITLIGNDGYGYLSTETSDYVEVTLKTAGAGPAVADRAFGLTLRGAFAT